MDVARLNFSHSTREEHSALYGMVREIAAERGRVVGVLADLQGPKIRLGCFADGPVTWATGELGAAEFSVSATGSKDGNV